VLVPFRVPIAQQVVPLGQLTALNAVMPIVLLVQVLPLFVVESSTPASPTAKQVLEEVQLTECKTVVTPEVWLVQVSAAFVDAKMVPAAPTA
jgi:hypothetical protein